MNSFGTLYRLTSFGESHGRAIGGVIDGMPAGMVIDLGAVQTTLDARRPGTRPGATPRREADRLQILSGLMALDNDADGSERGTSGAAISGESLGALTPTTRRVVTLGTPIGFMVENTDARSGDYDALRSVYRPSHADMAWERKYGVRDWRGGGRSSGRETISRVVAGAFAEQLLAPLGVAVQAKVESIGGSDAPQSWPEMLRQAQENGDSLGGVVRCVATGVPAGWGEPTFGKLQQMLGGAMLSIGAVKGFEYGDGFAISGLRGTEAADQLAPATEGAYERGNGKRGVPRFLSNHSGGIQGGISTGEPITMRVAFKPTATVNAPLQTVDTEGKAVRLQSTGRHDVCIAIRGEAVVRAMASMVLADAYLLSRASAPL